MVGGGCVEGLSEGERFECKVGQSRFFWMWPMPYQSRAKLIF